MPPPSLFLNGPKAFGVPVNEGYFVGPRPPPAQNLRQNTGPSTFTYLGPSTFHAQGMYIVILSVKQFVIVPNKILLIKLLY